MADLSSTELRQIVTAYTSSEALPNDLTAAQDFNVAAALLSDLQYIRKNMELAENELKNQLIGDLPKGTTVTSGTPGISGFAVSFAKKRNNWRDQDVIAAILRSDAARMRMFNEETGEIESEREATTRLLSKAARFSWRTTALDELKIDADEYSTTAPAEPSLRVYT